MGDQRLSYEYGVIRVIADHAAVKEEAVAPTAIAKFFKSISGKLFDRVPKRIANRCSKNKPLQPALTPWAAPLFTHTFGNPQETNLIVPRAGQ